MHSVPRFSWSDKHGQSIDTIAWWISDKHWYEEFGEHIVADHRGEHERSSSSPHLGGRSVVFSAWEHRAEGRELTNLIAAEERLY